ncbi:hypothetical protein Bbelb_324490 [Branchiostoma belcheri]|nr:hypothetical protein Bbelb_324490 [Branchiostoma belcheri]
MKYRLLENCEQLDASSYLRANFATENELCVIETVNFRSAGRPGNAYTSLHTHRTAPDCSYLLIIFKQCPDLGRGNADTGAAVQRGLGVSNALIPQYSTHLLETAPSRHLLLEGTKGADQGKTLWYLHGGSLLNIRLLCGSSMFV